MGLGENCHDQGLYLEATDHYKSGMELRALIVPPSDPVMGFGFCQQALTALRLGRFVEAASFVESGYQNLQKAFGTRQVGLSFAMYAKAELLRSQGKYKEVKPFLEQALYLRKQFLSDSHPLVAQLLISLSDFLFDQGALIESAEKLTLARDILQHFHASDHFVLAEVVYREGVLLRTQSQLSEAEDVLKKALVIQRHWLKT
jgi:tetratricopeptide (TPR) repeat protein